MSDTAKQELEELQNRGFGLCSAHWDWSGEGTQQTLQEEDGCNQGDQDHKKLTRLRQYAREVEDNSRAKSQKEKADEIFDKQERMRMCAPSSASKPSEKTSSSVTSVTPQYRPRVFLYNQGEKKFSDRDVAKIEAIFVLHDCEDISIVDVSQNPELKTHLEEEISIGEKQLTFPCLTINDHYIGGFEDLLHIHNEDGHIEYLLKQINTINTDLLNEEDGEDISLGCKDSI
jgi:glutaredoxin